MSKCSLHRQGVYKTHANGFNLVETHACRQQLWDGFPNPSRPPKGYLKTTVAIFSGSLSLVSPFTKKASQAASLSSRRAMANQPNLPRRHCFALLCCLAAWSKVRLVGHKPDKKLPENESAETCGIRFQAAFCV